MQDRTRAPVAHGNRDVVAATLTAAIMAAHPAPPPQGGAVTWVERHADIRMTIQLYRLVHAALGEGRGDPAA